jgi:hypothetical protein
MWFHNGSNKGTVLNFVQISEKVQRTFTVTVWKCVKTLSWTLAKKKKKRTGCCIMITHHLKLHFPKGDFWPKTTWLSSPTHPTFLFPQLKMKLKGIHFVTMRWSRQNHRQCWVPSQNTTYMMHLKNWRKCWERCILAEGGLHHVWWWSDASISPVNYGWLFV